MKFESVDEILNCDYSNESTEQSFFVVTFIMLVLAFQSVDEIQS